MKRNLCKILSFLIMLSLLVPVTVYADENTDDFTIPSKGYFDPEDEDFENDVSENTISGEWIENEISNEVPIDFEEISGSTDPDTEDPKIVAGIVGWHPNWIYTGQPITDPEWEEWISEDYNDGKPIVAEYENNIDVALGLSKRAKIKCTDAETGTFVFSRFMQILSRNINEVEAQVSDIKATEFESCGNHIVLTYNEMTLEEGKDYTIEGYMRNGNKLNVNVSANGISWDDYGASVLPFNPGNYDGQRTIAINIVPENLSVVSANINTGSEITVANAADAVTLSLGEKTLVKDWDYLVFSTTEKNGYAEVIFKGQGDFTGLKTVQVSLSRQKKDIATLSVGLSNHGTPAEAVVEPIKWTGKTISSDNLALFDNGMPVPKDEYHLRYMTNNVEVGNQCIYIISEGKNYLYSTDFYYNIVPRNITEDVSNESVEASDQNNAAASLLLKDKELGTVLVNGVDYEIVDTNVTSSQVNFTVHGLGHYSGYETIPVNIRTGQTPVEPAPVTPADPTEPEEPGDDSPQVGESVLIGKIKRDIKDKFSSDTVKFTSSAAKIATVTAKGIVTGKKAGDVTITGYKKVKQGKKTVYEKTGTYDMHVVIPRIKKLTHKSLADQADAYSMIYDNEDIRPDKWMSSNTKVATIDDYGTITALKAGTTNITAYYGNFKIKAALTVKIPKMNKAKATINAGKAVKLKLSSGNPVWSSSDSSVASVDSYGKVTGTGSGTAVITAVLGNDTFTSAITVKKPTLNKTKAAIKTGKTLKLKLSAGSAEWSSSDTSIVTVDRSGTVTGIKQGTATIKAVYGHDEVTCTITVK